MLPGAPDPTMLDIRHFPGDSPYKMLTVPSAKIFQRLHSVTFGLLSDKNDSLFAFFFK